MRTKIAVFHTYTDGSFRTEYGVKVYVGGRWALVGDSTSIYRVPSKNEAEVKRAQLRKEQWT